MSTAPAWRIGQGIDVHPLKPRVNGIVTLGGIEIHCGLEIEAESDGDILLHALADALLGAAGLTDIGDLYPAGTGAGLSGARLIRRVLDELASSGYQPVQVDLTLVAEQPKLAPWREQIRTNVAQLLHVASGSVGIKATTTDGLGMLGRKEGIAAFAVAVIGSSG
ncbi:MAG: 2-C-methyl-D-erythritol 2,4-cyclodiphosphate synthase [Gammaproteobacteria bacterium]